MTYRCPICDREFASERARFEHPAQTKTHESVSHLAECDRPKEPSQS